MKQLLTAGMTLLFFFSVAPVCAQPGADWSQGAITASGIGVPPDNVRHKGRARAMAVRAAKVDAQRNLVEILQGVNVDAETTVANAMADDLIRTRVSGVLRGARVVDTTYMDDGSVEVLLAVSMRGSLSDALLPKEGFAEPVPEPDAPAEAAYTGLIIDARELGLRQAMAPKVVDENDKLIYGAKLVDREAAVQNGIAAYDKDLGAAQKDSRVGNNPLVIKGTKASGQNKTNLIVSETDGKAVREATGSQTFLNKCKVIIVVD